MRCPACDHLNPDRAKFCSECGGRLPAGCPSCGAALPENARFCLECGTPVGSAPDTPRAAPLPASFANGRYTVSRFLGEGGKKKVYLVHDTSLDRDVAFSLIKTDGLDETGVERIRREARVMGRLGGHPHIVSVFDMGEESGQPFLVSELMAGGDVEGLIASAPERRPPLADTLRIADQVCQALAYAHEHGIIHRDLKPGNVWLTNDGTAKLGDFGLAMAIDKTRLSIAGMIVGTVGYMPPEQAMGRAPDARSDLYSLGAMLYELTTGRPPFLGDDPVAIISQHVNTPPVAPSWHNPRVPKPLETLILRLLEKDPASRPVGAALVRADLAAVAADSATPPTTSEQLQAAEQSNPLDRLAGGVFVGRDRELETLRSAVDAALSGRSGVVLLAGEPGIGKSRLAEEIGVYATLRGAQVLWGRAYEWEGAPAYWSWVQILRDYVHERDPQSLRSELGSGAPVIAQVVSAVRERLPDVPEPPRAEGESARFRLFEAITAFLRNASARQPLVLVLDDLQWADQGSLSLLPFVVRELRAARVLILGTYRDAEIGRHHPLAATLADLTREQRTQRIVLRGLSQVDVARYLTLTTGQDQTGRLSETVYRETDGNAFFVSEVVRLLASEGRLDPGAMTDSVTLPQGVREVIGRRLDKLSAECNELLAVAAVVGREFSLAILERVTGKPAAELLDLLEEALKARQIRELEGAGQYRFSQELIQETLYEELTTSRRLRLHGQIGETLEALYGAKRDSHLSEIAHHYYRAAQAGYAEQAIAFAIQAAERAAEQIGYDEAIAHYSRALELLEAQQPPDELRRCAVLLALGQTYWLKADIEAGLATSLKAADAARALGQAEYLARAVLDYSGSSMGAWRTAFPGQTELLQEALAALPSGDSELRARVLSRLGLTLMSVDEQELARANALADEAVAMARRLGDDRFLLSTLDFRWWFLAAPERLPERVANVDEIERLADTTADVAARFSASLSRCWIALEVGDVVTFDRVMRAHATEAERLHRPLYTGTGLFCRAARARMDGRFGDAERLTAAAAEQLVTIEYVDWYVLGQLLPLYREQGRLVELDGRIGQIQPHGDQAFSKDWVRAWGAVVDWELGRFEKARASFEAFAAHEFADLPRIVPRWMGTIALLSELAANLNDAPRAASLHELLQPFFDRLVIAAPTFVFLDPASRYLGLLATTMGHFGDAERHFTDALAMDERMGARSLIARTRYDFAEMLVKRDAAGDRERALVLLDQALAAADEIGMTHLSEQALALKVREQGILKA